MEGPLIVVHPPRDGERLLTVLGEPVGIVDSLGEIELLLRRAGLSPADVLDDPDLIEWRGGGPEVWG
ncbi:MULTISPECIES: hypothetical protein [Streptomyces]|uniref:Uncharacterized protein n=1 Tax=Streptomyces silvisoli TaxID=3034235 RepID=A0ABT5ZI85_9ACTN|nr:MULTISPECIES: hypothetical protein [Streptomyces]MDF3289531.1 hypothetical protein [Streptomyces silvisoli]